MDNDDSYYIGDLEHTFRVIHIEIQVINLPFFTDKFSPSLYGRNGGMCMHDEATPHYIDLIDQTTLGHQFIKDEFGQLPRVGWQIDPFGHSSVQAYLLGAEVYLMKYFSFFDGSLCFMSALRFFFFIGIGNGCCHESLFPHLSHPFTLVEV